MDHTPQFLKIVDDARSRITEIDVHKVQARLEDGEDFVLIDVREDREWDKARLPGAVHLGKGVIERDIETTYPEPDTALILYCGGGYRSAMAADNLQKMGYTHVQSMDGGVRGWKDAGYTMDDRPIAE